MRTRDRFLPIFLLSLALSAPAVLPGAALAEASVKDQKPKKEKKDKDHQSDDWNNGRHEDQDDDWDDDDGMRFRGMDTNGDGRVTRREWRGNDRSFDNQDWNRDGVLSGDEVRPGGYDDEDGDSWTDRFNRLDRNDDGYLSASEWPQDPRLFDRFDLNDDGRLSRSELARADDRPLSWDQRFAEMDANRDGRLSPREWQRNEGAFERLDQNHDGYVSRAEFLDRDLDRDGSRTGPYPRDEERFQHFDRNRDRRLSRGEWTGSRELFDRLDRDDDGYLSVREWMGW